MGLDMFLYKTKPITKDEGTEFRGMKEDEIDKRKYTVLYLGDLDGDITKCGNIVSCLVNKFNENRMRTERNIPPEYKKSGAIYYGDGGAIFFYHNEDATDRIEIKLSDSEYETFLEYIEEPVLICRELRDIYYWRKQWDIHDLIQEALGTHIENCGYYILNQKAIDAISEADLGAASVIRNEVKDDDILIYHPWW